MTRRETYDQRRRRQEAERQWWAQRDRDRSYEPLGPGAAHRVPVRYG